MKRTNEVWLLLSLVLMIYSCGLEWEPTFNERAAAGQLETVAIADIDQALTFARVNDNLEKRVIAVRRYQSGRVYGVDLSIELKRPVDDPITTYLEYGYEALRNIITHASPKSMVSRYTDDLVMPADLAARHVAAGLNFSEHAGETGVQKSPFLFPSSDTLMWKMSHQARASPPAKAFPDFCRWAICSLSREIGVISPKN